MTLWTLCPLHVALGQGLRHLTQAQPSGLMSSSFLVPGSGLKMPRDETGVAWAFWKLLSAGLVLICHKIPMWIPGDRGPEQ